LISSALWANSLWAFVAMNSVQHRHQHQLWIFHLLIPCSFFSVCVFNIPLPTSNTHIHTHTHTYTLPTSSVVSWKLQGAHCSIIIPAGRIEG
jgi:hypothetical protein